MALIDLLLVLLRRRDDPVGPSWFQLAGEFHDAVGRAKHRSSVGAVTEESVQLCQHVLDEEVNELRAAVRDDDLVAIADALADIVYVTCGNGHTYGLDLDRVTTRYPIVCPMTGPVLVEYLDAVVGDLLLHFGSWCDRALMAHCLVSVVAVCDWAAFSYGFDLDPVVREVHLSNMTKVGPDGCVALREDGKVLKGPGYRPPDIAGVLAQTNDRPLAA